MPFMSVGIIAATVVRTVGNPVRDYISCGEFVAVGLACVATALNTFNAYEMTFIVDLSEDVEAVAIEVHSVQFQSFLGMSVFAALGVTMMDYFYKIGEVHQVIYASLAAVEGVTSALLCKAIKDVLDMKQYAHGSLGLMPGLMLCCVAMLVFLSLHLYFLVSGLLTFGERRIVPIYLVLYTVLILSTTSLLFQEHEAGGVAVKHSIWGTVLSVAAVLASFHNAAPDLGDTYLKLRSNSMVPTMYAGICTLLCRRNPSSFPSNLRPSKPKARMHLSRQKSADNV
jgi:hypothetical protein